MEYITISEYLSETYGPDYRETSISFESMEEHRRDLWKTGRGIYALHEMINFLDNNTLNNLNGGMIEFTRKDKPSVNRKFMFKFNGAVYVYIDETEIKPWSKYKREFGTDMPWDFIRLDKYELDDFVLNFIRKQHQILIDESKIEKEILSSQIDKLEKLIEELKIKHDKCEYFKLIRDLKDSSLSNKGKFYETI